MSSDVEVSATGRVRTKSVEPCASVVSRAQRFGRCGTFLAIALSWIVCVVLTISVIFTAPLKRSIAYTLRSDKPTFFYFNPDSSQSNLGRLKQEADLFFSRNDLSYNFQPFAHLMDFDRRIREQRPAFSYLPHWYMDLYGSELKLKPLLVSVRQSHTTYRKVLLAAKNIPVHLASLQSRTLAMTTMGPESPRLLNRFLFSAYGVNAEDLNPIIVPKDSDALFALILNQVEMALVVKDNLDQMSQINPKLMASVKILAESKPIPMPLLCYTEEAADPVEIQKIKAAFVTPPVTKTQADSMEIFQVDEWRPYPN